MASLSALCALAALAAGCSRTSAPDGMTLLARSHGAEQTLCYTVEEANENVVTSMWPVPSRSQPTVRMYSRPVTTMVRRTECGPDQKRYEILASNAPGSRSTGVITVQNGAQGWRIVPAARRMDLLTFPTAEMGPFNWLALVLNNYSVEDVRPDSMAGGRAWYLELRPRHPHRPMKRLWLDAETYLPLRQELWGPEGRLLSATQAMERPRMLNRADGSIVGPPADGVTPGTRVVRGDEDFRMPPEQLSARLGFPVARLDVLPPGFIAVGTYMRVCPDTLGPCARWELTDGVAVVNILQTRANMGEMHDLDMPQDVQGPIEMVRRGPYHFIVRGNLPERQLRTIAEGIRL